MKCAGGNWRRFPVLIVLCIAAISLGGCFEGAKGDRAIRVRQGRRGLKASKARRDLRGYREKTARMEYRARPAPAVRFMPNPSAATPAARSDALRNVRRARSWLR